MESVITRSPEQLVAGLAAAAAHTTLPDGPFDTVLLAGMGGSWMAGHLVADAGLATIPINIHRSYGLPAMPPRTLVIVSSFSGNTEEALSAYDAARAAGASVIGIAADGELARRCANDRVPFVKIPADPPTMQPRSATGYGIGILVQLLTRMHLAQPDAEGTVRSASTFLTMFMGTARDRGEALAPALVQSTPVIYASQAYGTVAHLWKIKVNENAKTPAFWNVFPELNHNEMVGWTSAHGPFHVVVLKDPDDDPQIQRRMEMTLQLLRDRGIPGSIIPIEGGSRLERMLASLLTGDWFSTRLALELGTDPSPVAMVEDLKKQLKEA